MRPGVAIAFAIESGGAGNARRSGRLAVLN
jgi:hypothetical protein